MGMSAGWGPGHSSTSLPRPRGSWWKPLLLRWQQQEQKTVPSSAPAGSQGGQRAQVNLQLRTRPAARPAPWASVWRAACSMAGCLPRIHSELGGSLWDLLGLDSEAAWLAWVGQVGSTR